MQLHSIWKRHYPVDFSEHLWMTPSVHSFIFWLFLIFSLLLNSFQETQSVSENMFLLNGSYDLVRTKSQTTSLISHTNILSIVMTMNLKLQNE